MKNFENIIYEIRTFPYLQIHSVGEMFRRREGSEVKKNMYSLIRTDINQEI